MTQHDSAFVRWFNKQPRWLHPIIAFVNLCLMLCSAVVVICFLSYLEGDPQPHVTCIWTTTGHKVCGELEP